MKKAVAILADGDFPVHARPVAALRSASRIVCCDGSLKKLLAAGLEPDVVIGDLDSLDPALRRTYRDRIVRDRGQDDNDLCKAFRHCLRQGWRDLVLLGATGLREDHTLANISLLPDFAREARVRMLTDYGEFVPLLESGRLPCRKGQGVSIFSFDPQAAITSSGLKYPLRGLTLTRWWQATLNFSVATAITLRFKGGPLLVYFAHSRKPFVRPPPPEPSRKTNIEH